MAQLGYVGQSVFNNMHMLPHSMQQDLVNAVASGNSDLVQAATQAATQRFMAMAQVRVAPLPGRLCWLRTDKMSLLLPEGLVYAAAGSRN